MVYYTHTAKRFTYIECVSGTTTAVEALRVRTSMPVLIVSTAAAALWYTAVEPTASAVYFCSIFRAVIPGILHADCCKAVSTCCCRVRANCKHARNISRLVVRLLSVLFMLPRQWVTNNSASPASSCLTDSNNGYLTNGSKLCARYDEAGRTIRRDMATFLDR